MDTYEYIRVEIRVYNNKKIWSGFLLRDITYFSTYGNFVLEIQAKCGLRNVPGRCPVLGPRIQQVVVLASSRNRCDCQLTTRVVNVATLLSKHAILIGTHKGVKHLTHQLSTHKCHKTQKSISKKQGDNKNQVPEIVMKVLENKNHRKTLCIS